MRWGTPNTLLGYGQLMWPQCIQISWHVPVLTHIGILFRSYQWAKLIHLLIISSVVCKIIADKTKLLSQIERKLHLFQSVLGGCTAGHIFFLTREEIVTESLNIIENMKTWNKCIDLRIYWRKDSRYPLVCLIFFLKYTWVVYWGRFELGTLALARIH